MPWTKEQEAQLRELVETGQPMEVIAARLGKSKGAVSIKADRLGLKVVVSQRSRATTTSEIALLKELPSVEEALMILAGALTAASKSGLEKVEVQRLQAVATLTRTYKELLVDYIDYRGIEAKLVELEAKYAKLARKAKRKKATNYAGK
ncbi:MAG: hypothetical protein GTN64_05720 [Candidatus Latescibacteria bacterium]|nr:hypothetical protein [Candidatus Latescibacterota bacterium]NIO78107.1 hypothetical protein [Candidatus Latescibacterota bacterium]